MTIHRIRLLGDPALRAHCEPILKPNSAASRMIVDDLAETLADAESRYGLRRALSAPEIGAPVRIVYVNHGKPWVLFNPEIIDIGSEDFSVWDDCYCFPTLKVRVQRAYRIRVRYNDVRGVRHEIDLEGEQAELIQHQLDHLDGVLSVDRATGADPFCLREEWHRWYTPGDRISAPEIRHEHLPAGL